VIGPQIVCWAAQTQRRQTLNGEIAPLSVDAAAKMRMPIFGRRADDRNAEIDRRDCVAAFMYRAAPLFILSIIYYLVQIELTTSLGHAVILVTDCALCPAQALAKEATMKKVLVLLATALAIAGYVTLITGPEVTMTTQPDQVVACHGGDC
jgi:hypothetical protein